jgi:hypothetical protein
VKESDAFSISLAFTASNNILHLKCNIPVLVAASSATVPLAVAAVVAVEFSFGSQVAPEMMTLKLFIKITLKECINKNRQMRLVIFS